MVSLAAILSLFAVLTVIILLTFSDTVNFTLHAAVASGGLTPPQTTSPRHCDHIAHGKSSAARPRTPPWEVLLNDTATNRTRLYVHVWNVYEGRLGNRLFKYASLFGIAWKNGMVPVWPGALRTEFCLRIPSTDQHDAIVKVSTGMHHLQFYGHIGIIRR